MSARDRNDGLPVDCAVCAELDVQVAERDGSDWVCEPCWELMVRANGERTATNADLSLAVRYLLKKLGHAEFS